MVMPAAAGLFARAVAQSVPGTYFTPALARDVSAELVGAARLWRRPRPRWPTYRPSS